MPFSFKKNWRTDYDVVATIILRLFRDSYLNKIIHAAEKRNTFGYISPICEVA